MSQPKSPKQKMATIREVYDRILWDNRLDHRAFSLGFSDRISGNIREKHLSEWVVDGDIPWHRIRYVKCGETIVWDRDRPIDLFTTGELPVAAWVVATGNEESGNQKQQIYPHLSPPTSVTDFHTRPIYQYDRQNWQPIDNPLESVTVTTLKIASFNVLSDIYESEHTQTAQRIPIIIEHLRQCDADIIALQEVTPRLLEILLASDWVHDYQISESPQGETLEWHGLLLLSRLPFTLVEYRYSPRKRVLIGKWLLNGKTLNIAAVHFTSDYNKNAVAVRYKQLAILLKYLKTQPGDCLIVGDFNAKGNEQTEILTQNNFIDIWQTHYPEDPGYTFNPQANPLAALMSLTGLSGRLDRMMLRSQERDWISRKIELFACNPIPDTEGKIYPSDHFGILTQLESLASLQTIPPVYQSAVVIIPPDEICPTIQTIRRRCDRQFHRWMPHINIVYGFVPEAYFSEAAAAIAQALTKLEPFTITLSNFETFTHSSSCTAWLNPVPQPADALDRLQTILQQIFPQCNEQSSKSANGFTPHLTIGQFATAQVAQTGFSQWHPVTFQVDSIALISRRDNEPFEIRYRIPLKSETPPEIASAKTGETQSNLSLIQIINQLEPKLTQTQRLHQELIQSIVAQACQECLGYQPLLEKIGSRRIGVQSSHSDLDLLCIIPAPLTGETFLEQVQNRLAGLCERSQLVKSARVPVLRMEIEGVAVDLLSATILGQSQIIEPLSEADRPFFDPVSWSAVVGALEADLMVDTVSKHLSWDVFTNLLRAVRAWAKARQIHGNAWGFLGNFSWALLTAWTVIHSEDSNFFRFQGKDENLSPILQGEKLGEKSKLDILFAHFFQIISQHDWTQPIALTEAGKQYPVRKSREWLPAITSIAPCQNSTRNVTKSTAQILRRELGRGAEIAREVWLGNISWATLFESVDLSVQSNAFLILTVSAEVGNLEECSGWIEGHLIGLVINLEQKLNISVRPWPLIQKMQNLVCVVLGIICKIDEDAGAIAQISNEFIDQFNTANYHRHILKIELCDRTSLRNVLA
ncbi:poly(A) polymerase [Microcoleus sp. herbarium14]|uniref:poly(A) polymerase n=1 Tax=Microcoleus sp. herbarium14 TaxID=3055439 RepID=UPI002FCED341